ncbi:NAD(P)-dependent oxidoreductase [Oscillatoria amoena NRMC-F 0135]|nr:NAD(P)-dependent oxidoreductase [Oscillatoria amoena NRMC-F 0135]
MGQKILITGGSGFVGAHLLPTLPADAEALLLTSRTASAFKILPPGQNRVIHGDISRQGKWQEEVAGCDTVIHMAVYHHARDLDATEMAYIDAVNISGVNHLMRALSSAPPQRFIYLSSVKVSEWESLDERMKMSFSWSYARSKAQAEILLEKWAEAHGVELFILRVAPVYGVGNVANLGELFSRVAAGTFRFLGSGEQRKSLCAVDNLVGVILWLLQLESGSLPHRRMTVSDGPAWPVRRIVDEIAKARGFAPRRECSITNSGGWHWEWGKPISTMKKQRVITG